MNPNEQMQRATYFRDLNLRGQLLLPNAWDAASARVFEHAGFPAIGTTSGGIANARGLLDGEIIGRARMLDEIRTIVEAVRVQGLLSFGRDLDERMAQTIDRGKAYLAAGADIVFVPGVVQLDIVSHLSRAIGGPLSVMAMPGAPDAAALFAAGACRVSLGNTAMLAVLGALDVIAKNVIRTGAWGSIEQTFFGFSEADALFRSRP